MDRSVRSLTLLLGVLAAHLALGAEFAPVPTASEQTISLRTRQLLKAALPLQPSPSAMAVKSMLPDQPRVVDQPANGIVRLPDYVVRESRLPTAEQVMSRKAIEQYAMKKYLGPSDGFDRGFLNAFTFADLSRKIPVLGFLFALIPSVSNEDRAMMYYYEDKRLEDMRYLTELASLPGPNGDTANIARMRREVQKAFLRD